MSTYFWHDEGKGWTFTAAGRHYSEYATMHAAYLASVAVHPSSGDVFADLGVERPKGLPEFEVETEADDAKAKELYDRHTDNHPTIHSNRFPSWEELNEAGKEEWRKQAAALCVDEGCDHHGTDHICVEKPALKSVERKNGVPIDGMVAFKAGHLVSDNPYSSTSDRDYDNHSRWTDQWSRAAMDDNNETDNKGPVLPL